MVDKNMECDISVEFEESASRIGLISGENIKSTFGKIKKWLSDLSAVAFSGSYDDLTDKPAIATKYVSIGLTQPTDMDNGLWIKTSVDKPVRFFNTAFPQEAYPHENAGNLGRSLAQFAYTSIATIGYTFYGISDGRTKENIIRKFDSVTQTTTVSTLTLPDACYDCSACSIGTKAYIFGGDYQSGTGNYIRGYDSETDGYTLYFTKLPAVCYFAPVVAAVGTKCYIFGKSVYIYDTITNTCTSTGVSTGSYYQYVSGEAVGTDVFLAGGGSGSTVTNTIRKFSTLTNTFTTMSAKLSTPLQAMGCALYQNTLLRLWGGKDAATTYYGYLQNYDTETDTMTTLYTTAPRAYGGVWAIGKKTYLAGGSTDSSLSSAIALFADFYYDFHIVFVSDDISTGVNVFVAENRVEEVLSVYDHHGMVAEAYSVVDGVATLI